VTLTVHRAASVADLVAPLVRRLAEAPPADPFAPVEIAVPSRGMERWLTQRLAADLGATGGEAGICANVRFPFPGAVVQRVLASVLGDAPEVDPWSPDRLAWPLLSVLEDLPADDVWAPLRSHLLEQGAPAARRRFPLARRIADLFDRYALHRPDLVAGWAEGRDVGADGERLPGNAAWQPPLWRLLAERLPVPSPDRRFAQAISRLRVPEGPRPEGLPAGLTVFGVHSLPLLHLDLLEALAGHADVAIHAVTPTPAWSAGDPQPTPRHPLLVSCGAAALQAHRALVERDGEIRDVPSADDPSGDPEQRAEPATLLGGLQADLRADRRRGPGTELPPHEVAPGDRSVQVHACHGPTRQLEVLREVLLDLLERHRDLEPRDIVVMTPDIAAYEPLIAAAFSEGGGDHGVPVLPAVVADRSLRDENPMARALGDVLELVTARVTASAVLDLLASEPLRVRFELTPADLARLPAWVLGTGICWGVDADHRHELIGMRDPVHTWEAGLDRLALGATMTEDGDRMVAGVVPYDDVEGAGVDLLGRLVAATDALFAQLRLLREPRTITAWQAALGDAIDALLDPGARRAPGAAAGDAARDLGQLRDAIAGVVADSADAEGSPSQVPLTLEELRAALRSALGSTGGGARFGTGAITFTGLVPLRDVPHRVVCLLGMDDGALPRMALRHGFDLIAADPRPGDPDVRVEDRQLLLDAILAAGQHLVATYTGHDPRTNEARQPALPLSELLDVLGPEVREAVVTHHPLQAHSPRYFGLDGPPRAYDRRQLAAAVAVTGRGGEAPRFFPAPLPPPGEDELDPVVVELADLVRFLEHPIRALLSGRVGVTLSEEDRRLTDRDPTELAGLERWKVGDDLLTRQLARGPQDRWQEILLACGTVPVGGLGKVALDGIDELVAKICSSVGSIDGDTRPLPVDVDVDVVEADGRAGTRRVVGVVEVTGTTIVHAGVSSLDAKQRLATWVRLLAVTAAAPELGVVGRIIGRGRKTEVEDLLLRPPDPSDAAAALGDLVTLYLQGQRAPLPLLPKTSLDYAKQRRSKSHEEALRSAAGKWQDNERFPGEVSDAYLVQAFGPDRDLADLATELPFAELAERVWNAPLAHEESTPDVAPEVADAEWSGS
jgi:exodeoxyribonuclease V gamma subunit